MTELEVSMSEVCREGTEVPRIELLSRLDRQLAKGYQTFGKPVHGVCSVRVYGYFQFEVTMGSFSVWFGRKSMAQVASPIPQLVAVDVIATIARRPDNGTRSTDNHRHRLATLKTS